jgi:hypothetical protein
MTLQDFLVRVHDRGINREHLSRAWREMMLHNLAYDNLTQENKDFIIDLIFAHREKLFRNIHLSQSEIDHEYYRIWEKRKTLGLLENDLENVKEVLQSFKVK